jgi:hypothetical protein
LPFDDHAGYLRSRTADFLATIGLANGTNSGVIRSHADSEGLREVIRQLDALENPTISPILLTHILASDTSLDLTDDHFTRMTPLLETFLREIGDPIAIPDSAAAAHGLPSFRTTVPVFHCLDGFAAVIAPAMCKGPDAKAQIKALSPTVTIIFNETNFEIAAQVAPRECSVLIVKPSIPGLYHVWQGRNLPGIFSPFGQRQLLTARNVAFGIAMILQLAGIGKPASATPQERVAIIANLCRATEPKREFGMMAPHIYATSK